MSLKRAIVPLTSSPADYDPDQFDFVLHMDETRAVEPLEREALLNDKEPPETYPSGL